MEDVQTLKENQLDALREVANIGAGHAATALSLMIGSTIMITVPRINVARLQEMPPVVAKPDEPVAAVLLEMTGDLSGRTLLVFPKHAAVRLAAHLLHRPASADLGPLEESAIKEAGNILSSAYMNALSDFMGMRLLPSPPSLEVDLSTEVLTARRLHFGDDRDVVFCVESEFYVKGAAKPLRGYFLLLPDRPSLGAILRAVHVA